MDFSGYANALASSAQETAEQTAKNQLKELKDSAVDAAKEKLKSDILQPFEDVNGLLFGNQVEEAYKALRGKISDSLSNKIDIQKYIPTKPKNIELEDMSTLNNGPVEDAKLQETSINLTDRAPTQEEALEQIRAKGESPAEAPEGAGDTYDGRPSIQTQDVEEDVVDHPLFSFNEDEKEILPDMSDDLKRPTSDYMTAEDNLTDATDAVGDVSTGATDALAAGLDTAAEASLAADAFDPVGLLVTGALALGGALASAFSPHRHHHPADNSPVANPSYQMGIGA